RLPWLRQGRCWSGVRVICKFKKLVLAHAVAMAEFRSLKKQEADEYSKCPHATTKHIYETCVQRGHSECKQMNEEAGPYAGYSYEEVLWSMENPEACDHCKRTRELKKERAAVGRRIGAIRAAMTRAARGCEGGE